MKGLRDKRKEQGISQDRLAELTGIPQPNISAFEHGRHKPTQETKDKIEAIIGRVDWIETEKITLQITNFYKAERHLKKLVALSLTLCECDREELKNLIDKYFK